MAGRPKSHSTRATTRPVTLRQPFEHGTRPDVGRTAHVVHRVRPARVGGGGTPKGKGKGHTKQAEFQGPALKR